MPIYAYRCSACGHAQDLLRKISDPPLNTCPACGAEAFAKQVTAAGFQLKGSGWYVTDFRGGNTAAAPAASGGEAGVKDGATAGSSSGSKDAAKDGGTGGGSTGGASGSTSSAGSGGSTGGGTGGGTSTAPSAPYSRSGACH